MRRIANIMARDTRYAGARSTAMLDGIHFANAKRRMNAPPFTVQLSPEFVCVAILPLESSREGDSFGLFPTERKARNKLSRLASDFRLCHWLLGIAGGANPQCLACSDGYAPPRCLGETRRKSELLRGIEALWPLRVPAWPHRGAVGIRERSDMHVVDQWQFLGTACCESDLQGLLESRARAFDPRLYRLLRRTLPRLPADRIVDLSDYSARPHRAVLESTDSPMYQ
jgi:hypothetical protein